MAYVEERKRADGSVSYVVRWRAGGSRTGRQESEVFTEEPSAGQFRDLVNVHPFIEAEKQGSHSVKRACELLKVSRAAFYARRTGLPGRGRSATRN
ncbi:hypothetical protein GCM10009801_79950 [Streptomyces albiaxialis]|uniref:DNA binding HTH domain-containing protein n=1 Tax=Streptomyces albiaxialis TaxID=329523 RepID=A0ABP5IQA0_9ACTN